MKKILTIITALVVCYNTAKAQIVFSDNRPESPVVVHQVQSQVDTVYVLTEAGIEKAVMVTTVYKIIYEKTGEHEGNQFQGLPEFFVVDEKGYYANRVKPVGYYRLGYKTWNIIMPSKLEWYNNLGNTGIVDPNDVLGRGGIQPYHNTFGTTHGGKLHLNGVSRMYSPYTEYVLD